MTSKLFKAATNTTYTENGAVTHKSTLDSLLDFFYHSATKRGQDITPLFKNALHQDTVNAIVGMFYLRNIRGLGQGERELFRQCLIALSFSNPDLFVKVMYLVPDYGRWDDLTETILKVNAVVRSDVEIFVESQISNDLSTDHPSLLAKWMPSENTSSKDTRKLAYFWINSLGMTVRYYRKTLSTLRSKINIVEKQMSANNWSEIQYDRVPSLAMKNYRSAFGKHDFNRFDSYLKAVEKGEKKINASTLYPYDLVRTYLEHVGYGRTINTPVDKVIEAQWKALPNYAEGNHNALVMCDVSGSMTSGTSDVVPLHVSTSLAIYIAERNTGQFHNQFMTFSNAPRLITITGNTLKEKLECLNLGDVQNTNIQAAFDLILETAKRYNLEQKDLPETLFVVSDMEFDSCGGRNTNFEVIKRKFDASNYTMPKLVFWNVNSRGMQTPVTVNDKGVYLVSGCSPSIFKSAVNTSAVTAYDMMMEILSDPIFDKVREALA